MLALLSLTLKCRQILWMHLDGVPKKDKSCESVLLASLTSMARGGGGRERNLQNVQWAFILNKTGGPSLWLTSYKAVLELAPYLLQTYASLSLLLNIIKDQELGGFSEYHLIESITFSSHVPCLWKLKIYRGKERKKEKKNLCFRNRGRKLLLQWQFFTHLWERFHFQVN